MIYGNRLCHQGSSLVISVLTHFVLSLCTIVLLRLQQCGVPFAYGSGQAQCPAEGSTADVGKKDKAEEEDKAEEDEAEEGGDEGEVGVIGQHDFWIVQGYGTVIWRTTW